MKDKTLFKYLLWAFGLGWAVQIPAAIFALRGNALIFQGLTMLAMFAPLAAVMLADVPLKTLGWRWMNDYALPISLLVGMASAIPITAWLS